MTEHPIGEPVGSGEPTEQQIREFQERMAKITVDDVLLQSVVTLLNLAVQKAGLVAVAGEQGEDKQTEFDSHNVGLAIEGAKALIPLIDERYPEEMKAVKDTLSRLQLVYAQKVQGAASGPAQAREAGVSGPAQAQPTSQTKPPDGKSTKGPAQQSGRLWVPGS